MLAVGREGLETALFLWAQRAGDRQTTIAAAHRRRCSASRTSFVIAWAFYRGALKLNLRVFFAWTGADPDRRSRPACSPTASTTSRRPGSCPASTTSPSTSRATIPPSSVIGTLLKGVFNFSPATTWLEAVVWFAYMVPVTILFVARPGDPRRRPPVAPRRARRHRRAGVHARLTTARAVTARHPTRPLEDR